MAAITKRLLHLRPNFQSYASPHTYPLYHFSSASDPDAQSDVPQPDPNLEAQTRPSLPSSSSISNVKASLQQQPPPQNHDRFPRNPPLSGAGSTAGIHRQLSEFRSRSAAPPPSSSTGNPVSLQELYERNVNSEGSNSANSFGINSGGKSPFDTIRASLLLNPGAQNDSGGKHSDRWTMSSFARNMKLKGDANANQDSTMFTGGSDTFMPFLRGKGHGSLRSTSFRSTDDDQQELGKNLKMLRPQNRKGKWFSVQELSERLAKLRVAQEEQMKHLTGIKKGIASQHKDPKQPMRTLGFLGSIGGTESYELLPPKKDLVERYFHPDNMSSAEKIKLELKKVRDEFRMSESDCGSARVQVAQLTIKIKHLSTVLKKKDKHSRKGLQDMVQRRKKLLKYLRRTDWDSFCLLLSKLGLRDNPNIKA